MAFRDTRDIALGAADRKLKAKAKSLSGTPSNTPVRQVQRTRTLSFRRTGVSAEVLTGEDNFEGKVVEKSEDVKRRIRAFFAKNYLLHHLDLEQAETIVEAIEEVHFKQGDVIIQQGEPGEYFYLLELGAAEVSIMKPGSTKSEVVKQYSSGDSFGELALLYNAPRAATVEATTDCVMWAVDRSTFKAILMTSTRRKREMYESFLKEVPLLKTLNNYERAIIADVLEPEYFLPQQAIIVEGAKGDKFYLLEEGEAEARSQGKVMMHYRRGDYFGELALLNAAPRAATVTALTKCKLVAMTRDQFKRLFGKLEEILQRKKEDYEKMNANTAFAPPHAPLVTESTLPTPDATAPSTSNVS